jgi:hypothetical protein
MVYIHTYVGSSANGLRELRPVKLSLNADNLGPEIS